MKTQRPSHREPRPVPPSTKMGETGETWGNLRAEEAGLGLDDRFFLEDDPGRRVFQVTRVYGDPLQPGKKVLFYEAVER